MNPQDSPNNTLNQTPSQGEKPIPSHVISEAQNNVSAQPSIPVVPTKRKTFLKISTIGFCISLFTLLTFLFVHLTSKGFWILAGGFVFIPLLAILPFVTLVFGVLSLIAVTNLATRHLHQKYDTNKVILWTTLFTTGSVLLFSLFWFTMTLI